MSDTSDDIPLFPLADQTLDGVPGIGPSRRNLLAAAGITTRAGLHTMSPEQLISLTGMPRAQAERALAHVLSAAATAAQSASSPTAATAPFTLPLAPPPPDVNAALAAQPDTDEPAKVVPPADVPLAPANPVNPAGDDPDLTELPHAPEREGETLSALDHAVARAVSVLSDATRVLPLKGEKAERPFVKTAALLEKLAAQTATISPKRQKRLTKALETFAAKLPKAAKAAGDPKAKRKQTERRMTKLRERLKKLRDAVRDALSRV